MAAPTLIRNLLDSLPNSTNKTEKLEEIKTALLSLNQEDIKYVVANVSFNVIFESLQANDSHQLKLCTEVLDYLLSYIEGPKLLENFSQELQLGTQHGNDMVKTLCLRQILRVCEGEPILLGPFSEMTHAVILTLSDKLALAKLGTKILLSLGGVSNGAQFLLSGQCLEKFQSVMAKDDTTRYRVYEIVVEIAKLSTDNLQLAVSSGVLSQFTNEIYKDDILVQLNCLEMMAQFATPLHCVQYLDQIGIISKLETMLTNIDAEPMAGILLPGLIKFFGNVAHQYPKEICDRFQNFTNTVFGLCAGEDPALKIIAIETIGVIGDSADGKRALENQGPKMKSSCQIMGNTMQGGTSEIRIRVLEAVSRLLRVPEADQSNDVLSFVEHWFNALCDKSMETLMGIAKQPFTELRCAALNVFRVIAIQPWGQQTLHDHPGFVEYILDRSTEQTREGKDAKFDIIRTIVRSPTGQEIVGNVYFVRLREYVNQGPYYVRVEAAVAMESGD